MSILRELGARLSIAAELFAFLWERKLLWMFPLVAVLLLVGLLIGLGSSSGVGPFIYPLF